MSQSARRAALPVLILAGLCLIAIGFTGATSTPGAAAPRSDDTAGSCPPELPVPIAGGAKGSPSIVFTGLGAVVHASFFAIGSADLNHSGDLPASDWVVPIGDVDGDGLPDYRVEAPGLGPGGWGDPRTHGCPATTAPAYPPVAVVLWHEREDREAYGEYSADFSGRPGDGRFDVFEDRNGNGRLDEGEDIDGDGWLTGPHGCEGVLREDVDCDGHLDRIHEDFNSNGILDPGEDIDGDRRLDAIHEDRNGNGVIDWFDQNGNGIQDAGEPTEDTNLNDRLDPGPYIEDRNNNHLMDDRVLPQPGDLIDEVTLGGTRWPLPWTYPYGSAVPSRGGLAVATVAWDGTAYSLTAISNVDLETIRPAEGFEDLDGDGAFDVFEDLDRDGALDAGEDWDGDGRLTPLGGCEGVLREDLDCDGHLDRIHEDLNSNGILDPLEDIDGDHRLDLIDEDVNRNGILDPGEDTNLNDRLDTGDWIEDRNRNQMLDDRPFPESGDVVIEVLPDGTQRQVPATYPYGTFTPTGLVRPAAAGRLEYGGAPRGTGRRDIDPSSWRMQVGTLPPAIYSDQAEPRAIFSHLRIELVCENEPLLGYPLGCGAYRFLEGEERSTEVPLDRTGTGWLARTLINIRSPADRPDLPAHGILLPAGTQGFVDLGMPRQFTETLVDPDRDFVPIPEDSCPGTADLVERDVDGNGVADSCDRRLEGDDVWIDATTPAGPGARSKAAAAYDENRGVVVLFGGADDSSTWEWNGTDWRRVITPASPGSRRGHRMVYDSAARRVLLFGGTRLADQAVRGDLWAYDGVVWREIAPGIAPYPRNDAGLAFDSDRGRLVLFGGADGPQVFGDTWEFDGSGWRRLASSRSPAPRTALQMTYDPRHQVVVLQGGGSAASLNDMNDTWEFDGGAWQPVDHRGDVTRTMAGTMVFDPLRRQVVMFGGQARFWRVGPDGHVGFETRPVATARLFDGPTWDFSHAREAPPPRRDHAAAFDSRRGVLVAHGGAGPSGILADTAILSRGHDHDTDGVPDRVDNCPLVANPDQRDADGDGSGDACDNCGAVFNETQRDLDRDGPGDACDDDRDGDGVGNDADVCPDSYVAGRPSDSILDGGGPDTDGDGRADDCDVCPAAAGNDADGDGVCGDADNCPLVSNPLQQDATGDGYGDACQTTVQVLPVRAQGGGTLSARVLLGSPDGDPLSGQVTILPVHGVRDVLPVLDQGCATAFHPDGVAGEGIVYAAHPGAPTLGDADEAFGCSDGAPDFAFALGTCAGAGSTVPFQTVLTVPDAAPYTICVRRISGAPADFEYVVRDVGPGEIVLVPFASPLIGVPYTDTELPRAINLGALPGPGRYVLRVTAADGTTPEASDAVLFLRDRQQTLHLIRRQGPRIP